MISTSVIIILYAWVCTLLYSYAVVVLIDWSYDDLDEVIMANIFLYFVYSIVCFLLYLLLYKLTILGNYVVNANCNC